MLGRSSAPNLHVVTGHTPVPPKSSCSSVRYAMPSRPALLDDANAVAPLSSLLLASLCDAWHDIGDRTTHMMSLLKPKTV